MIENIGYATQPQQPSLTPVFDIDFSKIGSGQAPWNDLLSFTRASTASYIDANGIVQIVPAQTPRFAFDDNGNCLGIIVEKSRVNYLKNSANPATQTKSLTTGTYIFWMSGVGTVALSGGTTATVDENTPYIFSLSSTQDVIFTPDGDVTKFQCEKVSNSIGADDYAFPTTFIETPTSSYGVREFDDIQFIHTNWYNSSEGTFLIEVIPTMPIKESMNLWQLTNGSAETGINFLYQSGPSPRIFFENDSVYDFDAKDTISPENTPVLEADKFAVGYAQDNFFYAHKGNVTEADTDGTPPEIINTGYVGAAQGGSGPYTGVIKRIVYWDVRLDNTLITQMTS